MWTAAFTIVLGISGLVLAEVCRHNTSTLKRRFISDGGGSFSLFALPFIGRPQEGRRQVSENKILRHAFLIEMYVQGVLLIVGGFWQILD
jgi:hypothetical protein